MMCIHGPLCLCAGVRLEDSKALAWISRQTPLPPLSAEMATAMEHRKTVEYSQS